MRVAKRDHFVAGNTGLLLYYFVFLILKTKGVFFFFYLDNRTSPF